MILPSNGLLLILLLTRDFIHFLCIQNQLFTFYSHNMPLIAQIVVIVSNHVPCHLFTTRALAWPWLLGEVILKKYKSHRNRVLKNDKHCKNSFHTPTVFIFPFLLVDNKNSKRPQRILEINLTRYKQKPNTLTTTTLPYFMQSR